MNRLAAATACTSGGLRCRRSLAALSSSAHTNESLSKVLEAFDAPIKHAFAYGSGVFSQKSQSKAGDTETKDKPLVDFIFAVEDLRQFHAITARQHPGHYAFLRHGGPGFLAWVNRLPAGLYFHPYATVTSFPSPFKYGVISMQDLEQDLTHWRTFYVAGRMQKPVLTLCSHDKAINAAQTDNLASALRLALLLLPRTFSPEQLYTAITSLSYVGDPRTGWAEDPRKVANLVAGFMALPPQLGATLPPFQALYAPHISQIQGLSSPQNLDGLYQHDIDQLDYRLALFESLPDSFKQHFLSVSSSAPSTALAAPNYQDHLKQALRRLTFMPAVMQAFKGFWTAGPTSAATYFLRKLRKSGIFK